MKESLEMSKKIKTKNKQEAIYEGILETPLPQYQILGKGMTKDEYDAMLINLRLSKFLALYKHYGIDPSKGDSDKQLIACLATEHIQGFQFEKFEEPDKWRGADGMDLFFEVIAKAKERDWNFSWACQQLVKTEKYKGIQWRTLYSRFMEQKSKNPILGPLFNHDDVNKKRAVCDAVEEVISKLYK